MLIIGTAGHIDHGKSAIVRRLTGTDPDRLPEEKARGMTIDLGFAFRRSTAEGSLAFVDVPGHERFVKNMIAGAGAIDSVMLVIAADDGWMPQSEEHFQIVRLLGIERGLIVINKCDLAEPDWLDLLEEDVRDKVKGSFLADAPMFRVSAATGEGFDALAEYIDALPEQVKIDRDAGQARLYVDRSFVLLGIGGVVTGTLRGGPLSVGQHVSIWPARESGKIRSLHANDVEVETALPGQRTAISFSGIDKEILSRGSVITDRTDLQSFAERPIMVLSIELINDARVSLVDRRRVVLIIGTTEVEGEVRLLGGKELRAGEKGMVSFKPDDPVLSLVGDHVIVRLPTPMVTLGGGKVLDHLEHFPRKKDLSRYAYLQQRLSGETDDLIISELQHRLLVRSDRLLSEAAIAPKRIRAAVQKLTKNKTIGRFGKYLYHSDTIESASEKFKNSLGKYLEKNSHLKGLPREQLLQVVSRSVDNSELLLEYMLDDGAIVKLGDKYNLVGRGMSLKGKIREAHGEIITQLTTSPFTPPKLAELAKGGKDHKEAIKYIIESGEGYKCGSSFLFLTDTWTDIVGFIRDKLSQSPTMSVTDLKERFNLSRKFAIPIFEETDRLKLTERDGDFRIKGDRFESEDFTP